MTIEDVTSQELAMADLVTQREELDLVIELSKKNYGEEYDIFLKMADCQDAV